MTITFLIFFLLLFAYSVILFVLAAGFLKEEFFTSLFLPQPLKFTIIICARNEEKKIARCLKTILDQDYKPGNIQLILINDASSDHTVKHAEMLLKNSNLDYSIISNTLQKGKKKSIAYAMQFAAHETIILRDADTFTNSSTWLQCISDYIQSTKADFVIGPVMITDNVGPLWALQAVENNVLTLMSCGSAFYGKPFLASAANLVFKKEIFEKCNGFNSHVHISSGDDVLFLEDAKKIKGIKIRFLKSFEAIVQTYPCPNFSSLLNQKIRWAGKTKANPNKINSALGVLSFGINAAWIFAFVYAFLMPQNGGLSLIFVVSKLLIDILLLFLASRFLKNQGLIWYALPVACIYPLYACIVAVASVFLKPHWK